MTSPQRSLPTGPERRLAQRVLFLPRPLLIAVDVDGTLAPIVADPSAALVPAAVIRDLVALGRKRGIEVALITGRDAAALQRMTPSRALHRRAFRAVEHGGMILRPGSHRAGRELDATSVARLASFASWAETTVVPAGGRVEKKASSVAVHVREIALRDAVGADRLLVSAQVAAETRGLRFRRGRAVLEAEAKYADKAQGLRVLMQRIGARGVAFAGDDLTDLPAIRWAARRGGLGIFVTSTERPVAPRCSIPHLNGHMAVRRFLAALVQLS